MTAEPVDFEVFDRRIEDLGIAARITGRFLDRFARLAEIPRVP